MHPLTFTRQSALMLVAMSLVMLIVCIGLKSYVPKKSQLKNEHDMVLVNGTTAFKIWKDIPLPIYEKLYFFNITNAEAFLNKRAKLKVAEVGPYTYKGKWVKNILGWHPNGTVSYREETTYHFIPEESNGTENDVIVTLNGPLISAVNLAQTLPQKKRHRLSWFLSFNGEKLIIRKTVSELAYKGYKDAIMDEVSFFYLSEHFKDGRFSWLYGRNYSSDGFLTVFTGEQDFSKLNLIDNWNGKKRVCGSGDSLCNIITGTNGELSPPLKPGQMSYTFFQPAFCKSLTFELSGEETIKGILSHKFTATEATLNDLNNPCSSSKKSLPAGLRDLGSCYFGAPIIQSFPHFYLADSSLVQAIDGLNPDSKKHISYINVEPISGLSVELAMKYQINLPLKRFKEFQEFKNVSKGIIPVFWGEITASSTGELLELIENQIDRTGNRVSRIILGISIFVSVVTLIGSFLMLASTYCFKYGVFISRNDTVPLLQVTSQTPCINEYETDTANRFFMTVKERVMNIRSKLF